MNTKPSPSKPSSSDSDSAAEKEVELVVEADGTIRFVYDDDLYALLEPLALVWDIERASHVEPTPLGNWQVDASPFGGPPCLTVQHRRDDALAAEAAWLKRQLRGD